MSTHAHPAAAVVAMHTNGYNVNQVTVACPFCRGRHTHRWFGEPDGLRSPTCGAPGATYAIHVDLRARIEHMRTQYPTPDSVVGLVPLHIGYAYEQDGDNDVVGIIVLTAALGGFVLWLDLDTAVMLAGQLVTIAENAETLRGEYAQRAADAVCGSPDLPT